MPPHAGARPGTLPVALRRMPFARRQPGRPGASRRLRPQGRLLRPTSTTRPRSKNSTVVWEERTLDAWLTNPQALIPGQRMNFRVATAGGPRRYHCLSAPAVRHNDTCDADRSDRTMHGVRSAPARRSGTARPRATAARPASASGRAGRPSSAGWEGRPQREQRGRSARSRRRAAWRRSTCRPSPSGNADADEGRRHRGGEQCHRPDRAIADALAGAERRRRARAVALRAGAHVSP